MEFDLSVSNIFARFQIESPLVKWADHTIVFDCAFGKKTPLVGAGVVDGLKRAVVIQEGDWSAVNGLDRFSFPRFYL